MPKILERTSVKIRLLVFAALFVLSAYFIIVIYRTHLKNEEAQELLRLSSIAKSLVAQMDGDELEMIFQEFPNGADIPTCDANRYYQKQHEILEKTEQLNSLRVPIYTLTFDSLAQNFFIGIQSNDPFVYKQVFISHSEDLKETYHLGGTSCGYSDNQGKWLSA
ncbi:MAG: hypothetical protein AB7G44_06675, partial [Bacteroidia bacterium]